MIELLSYGFFLRSLLASILIGATCSAVGVFVVLRGLSFIGVGISHAAFAGVALAFLLDLNPFAIAMVFSLCMVWLSGAVSVKGNLNLDATIGILFSLMMALAILFIGLMRQYNAELYGYLFGSLLSINRTDLKVIGATCAFILALLRIFHKEFHFLAFDQEMAEASGLPTRALFFLLLTLMALTIVTALKATGELLVIALIVIPASSAYQLTFSVGKMTGLSVLIGVAASVLGLVISFYLDIPTSSSIVILLSIFFAFSMFISPKRRRSTISKGDGKHE